MARQPLQGKLRHLAVLFIGVLVTLTKTYRAFGGLIAFGIGHIHNHAPAWKWLFLIEGLPTFCIGLLMLYWLPDRPLKNSRFSGVDQEIARARYHSESFDRAGKMQMKHFLWVFSDWRLYLQAAIYLPTAALLASISGFLPTIISSKQDAPIHHAPLLLMRHVCRSRV